MIYSLSQGEISLAGIIENYIVTNRTAAGMLPAGRYVSVTFIIPRTVTRKGVRVMNDTMVTDPVVAGWAPSIPSSYEQWESDNPTRSAHGIGAVTKSAGLRDRDGNRVRLNNVERDIARKYRGVAADADKFLADNGEELYWYQRTRMLDTRESDYDETRHPDSEYWGWETLSAEEKAERLEKLSGYCSSAYDESSPPVVLERDHGDRHDETDHVYPCYVYGQDGRLRNVIQPEQRKSDGNRSAKKRERDRRKKQRQRIKSAEVKVRSDALRRAEQAREDMKLHRRMITQKYARDYELYRS